AVLIDKPAMWIEALERVLLIADVDRVAHLGKIGRIFGLGRQAGKTTPLRIAVKAEMQFPVPARDHFDGSSATITASAGIRKTIIRPGCLFESSVRFRH